MKQIKDCWLIGNVKWKDGYANISIAESKTRAKQVADSRLAYAFFDWHKNGEKRLRWYFQQQHKHNNIDELAKAVVENDYHCSDSLLLRHYYMLKHGIWIRSIKNGEAIHIKEPSEKAIKERVRIEKKWNNWSDRMIGNLLASFKGKS